VGPRAGLDDLEKRKFLITLGLELRPLGRPALSQSLYRLRYPKQVVDIKVTTVPEKLKVTTMDIGLANEEVYQ
jgi:hypothetical protein